MITKILLERGIQKMNNIAFRVDAGPKIGIGHLMRCIALANAFPYEDRILFISKP